MQKRRVAKTVAHAILRVREDDGGIPDVDFAMLGCLVLKDPIYPFVVRKHVLV